MSLEILLKDEIGNEFDELTKMQLGSDEYKNTVDGLAKLMDRQIELEKLATDTEAKAESQRIDEQLKLKQMKQEKHSAIVGHILNGVAIVGGFALTVWGAVNSWDFEKNDSITSTAGRQFMTKLFRK